MAAGFDWFAVTGWSALLFRNGQRAWLHLISIISISIPIGWHTNDQSCRVDTAWLFFSSPLIGLAGADSNVLSLRMFVAFVGKEKVLSGHSELILTVSGNLFVRALLVTGTLALFADGCARIFFPGELEWSALCVDWFLIFFSGLSHRSRL